MCSSALWQYIDFKYTIHNSIYGFPLYPKSKNILHTVSYEIKLLKQKINAIHFISINEKHLNILTLTSNHIVIYLVYWDVFNHISDVV